MELDLDHRGKFKWVGVKILGRGGATMQKLATLVITPKLNKNVRA